MMGMVRQETLASVGGSGLVRRGEPEGGRAMGLRGD